MASTQPAKTPAPSPRRSKAAPHGPARQQAVDASESRFDLPPMRHYVGYAVRRAQMRLYADFFAALEAEEITPARFTALMLIRHTPGIRSTDLAQALHIARSGVVKLLTWFEQQGLVRREAIDGDRRAQSLTLTEQGKARLDEIVARVEEHDRRVCADLSPAERQQLIKLLSRLAPPR